MARGRRSGSNQPDQAGTSKQRQSLDTKLAKWQCAGQGELFDEEATLTPEVREWRRKRG